MPEVRIPVPQKLLRDGVTDVLRISDGRMSGTSSGTVVLHVSDEGAVGGPIGLVEDGDEIEIDVDSGLLELHVPPGELDRRRSLFTARLRRGVDMRSSIGLMFCRRITVQTLIFLSCPASQDMIGSHSETRRIDDAAGLGVECELVALIPGCSTGRAVLPGIQGWVWRGRVLANGRQRSGQVGRSRAGLTISVVNTHQGPHPGDHGRATDERYQSWWRRELELTLELAADVGCSTIHLVLGPTEPDPGRSLDVALRNIAWALEQTTQSQELLLLEPLGPDRPNYLVRTVADVIRLRQALGDPERLRILFDTYHLQQTELDIVDALRLAAPLIGHVQLADAPGRNEPGSGSIDFEVFFDRLAESNYQGWLGLEYRPSSGAGAALHWLDQFPGLRPGVVS